MEKKRVRGRRFLRGNRRIVRPSARAGGAFVRFLDRKLLSICAEVPGTESTRAVSYAQRRGLEHKVPRKPVLWDADR